MGEYDTEVGEALAKLKKEHDPRKAAILKEEVMFWNKLNTDAQIQEIGHAMSAIAVEGIDIRVQLEQV
jgi:DnaJ-domain-containing protein 1